MTYEDGWEREYTRAVKTVSTKPVLLVGRITRPEVAEELLEAGEADAILLARQMFADAEWAQKAREGQEDDIRRCVAANYCWRSRHPGRARAVHLQPRRSAASGSGARGHSTGRRSGEARRWSSAPGRPGWSTPASRRRAATRWSSLEREDEVGGHVRSFSQLPGRAPFVRDRGTGSPSRRAGTARRSASRPRRRSTAATAEGFDHVVVATGARYSAGRLPGPDGRDRCPARRRATASRGTTVALGEASRPAGNVLVIDDLQDAAAPLTAIKLAEEGCVGPPRHPLADVRHGDDPRGLLHLDPVSGSTSPACR